MYSFRELHAHLTSDNSAHLQIVLPIGIKIYRDAWTRGQYAKYLLVKIINLIVRGHVGKLRTRSKF